MAGSILQRQQKRLLVTSVFAIIWIAAVAGGLRVLFRYENTPGSIGVTPRTWPTVQIERSADRPTLVMIAHPRCPCTMASLAELAKLMAQLEGKVTAYVLFIKPTGTGSDWEETNLIESAKTIPGLKVVFDLDGQAARRFGAETSGHTFLFDTTGRLVFSGGITLSRGHAGENAGENSIISVLNKKAPIRTRTLVFGCSLTNHAQPETGTAVCSK